MKSTATKTAMRLKLGALLAAAGLTLGCGIKTQTPEEAKQRMEDYRAKVAAADVAKRREASLHAEKAALAACQSDMLDKLERIHTKKIPAFGPDKVTNLGDGRYHVESNVGAMPFDCTLATADGKNFQRTQGQAKGGK